ncbi:MAG: hypothetical protein Q9M50_05080 [Methylococcales bacterium]|nr:hypothetical protein [Methylococcales bacterium]
MSRLKLVAQIRRINYSYYLILAHTMLLSSIELGARFYLVGVFLFATAAETILLEGAFAIDLAIMIPVIWIGIYIEKQ